MEIQGNIFGKAWNIASWFLDGPTFDHSKRVMLRVFGETDPMVVALLHDFVEDGGQENALEYLRDAEFPDHIIEAVDAISRREGEVYADYILRVRENNLATWVKLADLGDNLDGRGSPPKPSLQKRYERARKVLLGLE